MSEHLYLKTAMTAQQFIFSFFVGHLLVSILKIVPLILIHDGSYTAMFVYGVGFIILQYAMAFLGIGTIIDTGFGKKTNMKKIV
ncbi:MAG TPA: hypothetical protein VHP38_14475 [Ruminiclostridium sp.]|nr:hypothetical protein [Ruminiclostridium sp.]